MITTLVIGQKEQIEQAPRFLRELRECKALIVDLRPNAFDRLGRRLRFFFRLRRRSRHDIRRGLAVRVRFQQRRHAL